MGKLTTHILDTANGCPAAGVRVRVFAADGADGRELRGSAVTDADGRCGKPMLAEGELPRGVYELDFHIGDYFSARMPDDAARPPFLDVVTVRFGVGADSHYHIPLLASPYGYTTYRGS
ncbi:MAG: hydroxyisourate hydrolase [Gammaproteobacteria bacterium]